ncbi:sulfotransferase family protein [Kangiella shandongensis]|uniref:sulfotransferase family protein n=1 Tax=Kangiella shandongensis TaxID=2763258 RepID=UPI001CC16A47|nr:sulfotransferase [Kangiella shandongensis]
MSRVFIVGVGRSGTSLLQSIIASHPGVVAIPETGFLRRFIYMKGGEPINFKDDKNLQRCPRFMEELGDIDNHQGNIQLLQAYKRFTNADTGKVVLDKDPRLVECVSLLKRDFPDAKIINIYRDPRDVIASKKKASWSSGRSLLNYLVSSRVQLGDAKKADKMEWQYSIKYEDLISKPEMHIKQICNYLGLDYSADMLDHTKAAKMLVQEDEVNWKKETLKPINRSNTSKWLHSLTPLEALCSTYNDHQFIKKHDYNAKVPNATMKQKLFAFFIVSVSIVAAGSYRLIRNYKYWKARK